MDLELYPTPMVPNKVLSSLAPSGAGRKGSKMGEDSYESDGAGGKGSKGVASPSVKPGKVRSFVWS